MGWLPLESNPHVLTKYMRGLGLCKGYACSDILGLDPEVYTLSKFVNMLHPVITFQQLLAFVPRPVHAVFLLFPHHETTFDEKKLVNDSSLYFMKQDPEIGEGFFLNIFIIYFF